MITLTRWPRSTYPGIIQLLTNLRLLDYAITVNVDPLPVTREITRRKRSTTVWRATMPAKRKSRC